jgi:hypothetical protein
MLEKNEFYLHTLKTRYAINCVEYFYNAGVVNRSRRIGSRGRCYDHNFLRIWTIFGEKIDVFLKNQCYDQFFSKFSFVLSQKTPMFSLNFSAKIFLKIITSVPDKKERTQTLSQILTSEK